jgi:hypothetical protein
MKINIKNSLWTFLFFIDQLLMWCRHEAREAIFQSTFLKGTQAWDVFEIFFFKSNPYMPLVNFRKKFRLVSFDFRQNFEVRTFTRWLSIRGTKFFLEISKEFFVKIFTMVLLDVFLDGFSKFWFFKVELCILIGFFESFSKTIECVCWAYAETILSHAEHARNRFHRILSIRGTNFRACSASGKCELFYMYNLCWAYAEWILSHTEHTWNEFYCMLSILGTDFIACWACAEMFKSRISLPIRIRFLKISCYRPLGPYGFGFCKKSQKKNFMLVYL